MAKPQTQASRSRRFFSWFGRHKVTAAFSVLLLGAVLFLGVNEIVWRVQVHNERTRFNNAAEAIARAGTLLDGSGLSRVTFSKSCTHSNFGGVFEADTIACDAKVQEPFATTQQDQVTNGVEKAKQFLTQQGAGNWRTRVSDVYTVTSYDFTYQKLDCLLDASFSRTQNDEQIKKIEMEIDCGGKAQENYFPVVNN